jgi:hypothetical protein
VAAVSGRREINRHAGLLVMERQVFAARPALRYLALSMAMKLICLVLIRISENPRPSKSFKRGKENFSSGY